MATIQAVRLVGAGVDRVDGPLKVAGAATYPTDFEFERLAHAVLVGATIAAGRIRGVDSRAAEASPGVLEVITHRNAARLEQGPSTPLGPQPPAPLQDDQVSYHGHYVAVVVAESAEQAAAAARLLEFDYEAGQPLLDVDDPRTEVLVNPWGFDAERGEVAAGLSSAEARVDATYTTPEETNNPMGLFATVAFWDGDRLTVHDANQHPDNVQEALAGSFQLPEENVRVLTPYVGGGFGAGLRNWPHVILAALAARTVGRPVKLVLTRPQMFTGIGHRPPTESRIRLGATRDGQLTAIDFRSVSPVAMERGVRYRVAPRASTAYASPNLAAHDRHVRLNIPAPAHMRAPGGAEANFALESAIDELAAELEMDPLDLRLRNFADTHPPSGLPWSSNHLRECYRAGAERFGWSRRDPEPGSTRDGPWLVGYGMAGVTFDNFEAPCDARASIGRDGQAFVRSAATDIGTGTYTVMTQLSAELLGLGLDQVSFSLGDTEMPMAPQQGGSGLTASLGNALRGACRRLVGAFLEAAGKDPASPLQGCGIDEVAVAGGRIHRVDDPGRGEAYTEILANHGLEELSADGHSAPPRTEDAGIVPAGVRRQVRRGARRPRPRPRPRRPGRLGRRRWARAEQEARRQSDHRRHGRGHRHGPARGHGEGPGHRAGRQRHLQRLPDRGERRRARPGGAVRRRAGPAEPGRCQGHRRDPHRRHRRRHRQCGPPRHRQANPQPADYR
jgi:xanthine dehydrogenase YagR molybdenum-binding subunit